MLGFLLKSVFRTARYAVKPPVAARPEPITVRAASGQARPKPPAASPVVPASLKGKCHVIDGDTIVIRGTRIRIAGIDAPELDHPYGKNSKFALIALCKGRQVEAVVQPDVSYDRVVATCFLEDGTDLAAELVRQGLALDWPRFSGGAYRHLEPEGARKKLWRCAAKHQGRLKTGDACRMQDGR